MKAAAVVRNSRIWLSTKCKDSGLILHKGVIPDISIPFPLEYTQGVDSQKQKAIETLLKAQFPLKDG